MKTLKDKDLKKFASQKKLNAVLYTDGGANSEASKAALEALGIKEIEVAEVPFTYGNTHNVEQSPTLILFNEKGKEIERLSLVSASEAKTVYERVLKSYIPSDEEE